MSSSSRFPGRRAVCLGFLAAGCGFTPLYGPDGVARDLPGSIAVDPPSDLAGFVLVEALERRLGQPQAPRYRLAATVGLVEDSLGITADQVISRFRLRGRADYRIIEPATGRVATSGNATAFVSYSATQETVGARASRRDAERRLMRILADQIVTELASTAGDWA